MHIHAFVTDRVYRPPDLLSLPLEVTIDAKAYCEQKDCGEKEAP